MKGLLCALLLATSTLAAQQPVDSGPLPRYPKAWIAAGADVGLGSGAGLSSGFTIGGRANMAWRFAHRGVLQVQGFVGSVANTAQNGAAPCPGITCADSSANSVQRVTGASAMLGYLRGSFGTSSMLVSAGPALVHVRGTISTSATGAGVQAELDQTFVEGNRAALTIHVSPILAPSVNGAAFWWIPVGLAVRFW